MSVKRCQQEVDSAEFTEWQIFHAQEPIGQYRQDLGFAMLAAVISNRMRGDRETAHEVSEFMLPTFEVDGHAAEVMSDKVTAIFGAAPVSFDDDEEEPEQE